MMENSLILTAKMFAKQKHCGQFRDNGKPFYEAHCLVVYNIVNMRKNDIDVLCASLLHDTIEDTNTTYDEIKDIFGKDIADLVLMVTHTDDNVFPLLKFENDKYSEIVHKAMIIKHADTFVNVSEMDNEMWTKDRKMEYLNKKMSWRTE